MVKHVILWQLKEELSDTEKAAVKAGIKEGLEGLAGQIPGLVDIRVNIDALPSSNADLMLDTTFESAEALKGYSLAFLILAFTPVTSLVYRILFGVAIGGDLLYLVAYESWNHSAD